MAEKRQRARLAGFCITCCTKRPSKGYAVCQACKEQAHERRARRRVTLRQRAELQHVIEAHERKGDTAREHHLYEDAAEYYQNALNVKAIAPPDWSRISEKLALALSLSANPKAANPLFDRVSANYLDNPTGAAKAVEMLLQQARQLWIGAKRKSALPLLLQAKRVAEETGNVRLYKLANSRMADYLAGLCRYKEAEAFLDAMQGVDASDDVTIQATYYTRRGSIAAAFGNAHEAFNHFERAVHAAKGDRDIIQVVSVWLVYGFWALALGNTQLAKTCYERALLVGRKFHIVWLIPYLCIEYARVLFLMGYYGLSYEYLLSALTYDTHTALADIAFAETGIPITLFMKDEAILAKCVRSSAIDAAFQSGQPGYIGPVAAAFAQLYAGSGREPEAQALLHQGIEILQNVEQLSSVSDFPLAVARFGSIAEIPKARRLIEIRAAFPYANVAHACLKVFDAFVAQRHGQVHEAQHRATEAVHAFEVLGWNGYADLAHTLLPAAARAPHIDVIGAKPFVDLSSKLTLREQQVAELVLKGMTNRAIADALSIKERTVESHMTSIMSHLGVRSRHQLMGVLEESGR